ncbi:uncharacterized protein GGS25DRAFT_200844 [Hypoxylon fragiforme]|uniref:uncharacterized protein n=1 Tax=Hypoxylon fragiforme TaxID=63214 RepID=UPI0020C6803F|nr:uncharacterized protein GGS25DRAFT_200844 [Hypoxylon fragiforme]KAI2611546.1 hypothetical protein GGS25DRAFT_200844 [Hypoxylon fragiforme]
MAPTTSTSKSAINANPAPDFSVQMNRIQMRLDKGSRAPFLSRSGLHSANASPGPGPRNNKSFSSLNTAGATQAPTTTTTTPSRSRNPIEEEEAGLDLHVGIGIVRASKSSSAAEASGKQDRDTARLRGRLLGKRGRGGAADGAGQKWVRREDSSDEEAGRGGLGRAKRNGNGNGKRLRVEAEVVAEAETSKEAPLERAEDVTIPDTPIESGDTADQAEHSPNLQDDEADNPAAIPTETSEPLAEGDTKKKRRKKKQKKKNKKQADEK